MSIEQGLVTYLLSDTGVAALVSDRIQPEIIVPDDQQVRTPAIVYSRVDGKEEWTNSGPSGVAMAKIAIDCIHQDYGQSKALSESVRAALGKFLRGKMAPTLANGGYFVQGMFSEENHDIPPEVMEKILSLGLRITRRIATIWYEESAVTT